MIKINLELCEKICGPPNLSQAVYSKEKLLFCGLRSNYNLELATKAFDINPDVDIKEKMIPEDEVPPVCPFILEYLLESQNVK